MKRKRTEADALAAIIAGRRPLAEMIAKSPELPGRRHANGYRTDVEARGVARFRIDDRAWPRRYSESAAPARAHQFDGGRAGGGLDGTATR